MPHSTVDERRYLPSEFEVRANEAGKHTLSGYGAKWRARSEPLGGFVESVEPGAFTKTLKDGDVRSYLNHDRNLILGRSSAGTLRLSEDRTGLHYEVELPNTSYARDLAESVERGDISQSSFGFRAIQDDWGFTERNYPLRSLREVRLFDVSPVAEPAYPDADGVAIRSLVRSLAAESDEAVTALLNAHSAEELAAVLRSLIAGEAPTEDQSQDDDQDDEPQTVPLSLLRKRLELIKPHI
jgi:HK97 family phage prohead protease